jgi:GT2 family glycosyltransferase
MLHQGNNETNGPKPLVSIITVNYNQTDLTCALLDSIRKFAVLHVEVILVDNASKIDPVERIKKDYPEVIYIRSDINLGFAGGNNLGLESATAPLLFLINNDAELTVGCLQTLVNVFEKYPNTGALSPLICYDAERTTAEGDLIQYCGTTPVHPFTARNQTIGAFQRDHKQYRELKQTAYGHGAALMVPRSVMNEAGPMSNDFFLYYEELDWCARIKRAGFDIFVEPNAKVYHKESVSVGAESPLKTYYINRNRIYFMRRNYAGLSLMGFALFLLLVTLPINLMRFTLARRWTAIKAFLGAIGWNIKNALTGNTDNPEWVPVGPPKMTKKV